MITTIAAFLTLSAGYQGQLGFAESFVLGEKDAVGLLPPVVACDFTPREVLWSQDGQNLLVLRQDSGITAQLLRDQFSGKQMTSMPGEVAVEIFNVANRTSKKVFSAKPDKGYPQNVQWMGGGIATFHVTTEVAPPDSDRYVRDTLYFASASTGKLTPVLSGGAEENIDFNPSPYRPYGVLLRTTYESGEREIRGVLQKQVLPKHRMFVVRSNGQVSGEIALEKGMMIGQIEWDASSPNPSVDVFTQVQNPAPGKPGFERKKMELDMARGHFVPAGTTWKTAKPAEPDFTVRALMSKGEVQGREFASRTLWLESKTQSRHQVAPIAGDAYGEQLSPTHDAIFYTTGGVGMVRQIVRIPKDAFLQAVAAAERTKIMSQAKQAATALMIYAADNDDVVPGAGADMVNLLNPYLKNPSLLQGFVYTFGGGNLSQLENPAETEIGYIAGPGGRAIAYADGHVKWKPD